VLETSRGAIILPSPFALLRRAECAITLRVLFFGSLLPSRCSRARESTRNTKRRDVEATGVPYGDVRSSKRGVVDHDYAAVIDKTVAHNPTTKPMLHAGRGLSALWTLPATVGIANED
jgi:hypothetical protein